jgi:hypothetical protein
MDRRVWLVAFMFLGAACTTMGALPTGEEGGLGTAWGETRASPVQWVAFERAEPTSPLAVATLYYDDIAGVSAIAAQRPVAAENGAGVAGGTLRVRVLDAWGALLPTFASRGRQYVMGRDGERYAIEIVNDTGDRIEAVATVDGLDAMDGGPGSFAKRGYVLDPWSSYRIDGFRRSEDEVAAFRFGTVAESYAARTGDDRNVGVIGVAFFAERGARRVRATPFPGRFAAPPP